MSPINRRNTRSTTMADGKNNSHLSISTESNKENHARDVGKKRNGTCQRLSNGKKKFCENNDLPSTEMTMNSPIIEPSFEMLQPVPLDICSNFDGPPASPPALLIDPTEEIISSQLLTSNSNLNISRTPFAKKNTNRSSNNYQSCNLLQERPINTNEEPIVINDELNFNRTPAIIRNKPIMFSQTQDDSIVSSIEQSSQISNGQSSYSCRTSTPSYPYRFQQTTNSTITSYNDSFAIDSISPETYEVLSKFPEFRKLVKAYKNEKEKCSNWINDYGRLKRKYDQLEENSFPRPSASGLEYLVELVTKIQRSGGQNDPRTNEQIAFDLGVNSSILPSFKSSSPQQSALNLFNYLYPSQYDKIRLDSVVNMERIKPGLLDTIFVFAQRSAPGVRYTLQKLKDAINGSIRSARFQHRRNNAVVAAGVGMMPNNNNGIGEVQQNNNQGMIHNNAPDNSHMDVDQ